MPAFAAGLSVGTGVGGGGVGDGSAVGLAGAVIATGVLVCAAAVTAELMAVPIGTLGTTPAAVAVGAGSGVGVVWLRHAAKLRANTLTKQMCL